MILNILTVFNEIQTSIITAKRRLKPKGKGKFPPLMRYSRK